MRLAVGTSVGTCSKKIRGKAQSTRRLNVPVLSDLSKMPTIMILVFVGSVKR